MIDLNRAPAPPAPEYLEVLVRCLCCGEKSYEQRIERGQVGSLNLVHEDDCAFLAAVESDDLESWVEANGDPIRYTTRLVGG